VRFVIAHCGNPWIESAAEVAYKNPNVFLECSAMVVGDSARLRRLDLDQLVVRPIAWVFTYVEDPSKLMFGSDWPLVDVASYVEAYKRAIPREHWRKVFYENALRVFKIAPDDAQ
jgi:predicted TIM-barrel fold metal-dependent hydrolase